MPQHEIFAAAREPQDHVDERVILSARAEMASRCCDSRRLHLVLGALVLDGSIESVALMNARLEAHAELRLSA